MKDTIRYTFPKEEHLKSVKQIQQVFSKGSQVFSYPLKLIYLKEEGYTGFPKVLCSASKRYFKHAVDRNRIKRLIREAYRLRKPHVFNHETGIAAIAFIYVGKKIENYETVERGMEKVLTKLLEEV